MKASVIITNFNFAQFLVEAIESVLNQTYQNLELIIVDDGSTDNSIEVITRYMNNAKVKTLFKENGGQLSCINQAFPLVTGDILFLLDSDDSYKNNYVEETIALYQSKPSIDIISCQHIDVNIQGTNLPIIKRDNLPESSGFTLLATYYLQDFIGNITSTMSMRFSPLKRLMPIDLEKDWSNSSIDTLFHFAFSLSGNKALKTTDCYVFRKRHDKNNTFKLDDGEGKKLTSRYRRHWQIIRLFNSIFKKHDSNIKSLDYLIAREYVSRNPKSIKLSLRYLHILFLMDQTITFKFSMIAMLVKVSLFDKKE